MAPERDVLGLELAKFKISVGVVTVRIPPNITQ